MVHGACCMLHGACCMLLGAWRMVHGAWCMMHGAWRMVHGTSFYTDLMKQCKGSFTSMSHRVYNEFIRKCKGTYPSSSRHIFYRIPTIIGAWCIVHDASFHQDDWWSSKGPSSSCSTHLWWCYKRSVKEFAQVVPIAFFSIFLAIIGAWCKVHGARCIVHRAKCAVHRASFSEHLTMKERQTDPHDHFTLTLHAFYKQMTRNWPK